MVVGLVAALCTERTRLRMARESGIGNRTETGRQRGSRSAGGARERTTVKIEETVEPVRQESTVPLQ